MTYAEKLKDPRWQRKRLDILQRDNFACTICGSGTTTLHVHHEKYKGNPWDIESKYLKTLCENCHHDKHKKPEVFISPISSKPFFIQAKTLSELTTNDWCTEKYPLPATIGWHHKRLNYLMEQRANGVEYLENNPLIINEQINYTYDKLAELCREHNVFIQLGEESLNDIFTHC